MKIIKISKNSNKKIETAIMIVKNKIGKILILKREENSDWMPNKWNFPGGSIEDGESEMEAAIRECEEEAGISPSNIRSFKVFDNLSFFIGDTESSKVKINNESSEYKWIHPSNAGDYDLVDSLFYIFKTLEKEK